MDKDKEQEARDYADETISDMRVMTQSTLMELLENAFRAGWEKHEEMADEIESGEE